jgi:hypothetical protein
MGPSRVNIEDGQHDALPIPTMTPSGDAKHVIRNQVRNFMRHSALKKFLLIGFINYEVEIYVIFFETSSACRHTGQGKLNFRTKKLAIEKLFSLLKPLFNFSQNNRLKLSSIGHLSSPISMCVDSDIITSIPKK